MLFVNAHEKGVILQHPKREAALVGRLELNMMKRTVFGADDQIGAMVEDLRLFRRQKFNDPAAKEQSTNDSSSGALEQDQ